MDLRSYDISVGIPLGFPFVDTHGLARTATWPGDLFENKKAEGTKLLWGSTAGAWPPATKAEKQLIDAAMVSASVASDGRQPTKGFWICKRRQLRVFEIERPTLKGHSWVSVHPFDQSVETLDGTDCFKLQPPGKGKDRRGYGPHTSIRYSYGV
ncbi:hypothetical protein C4D60_Mb06t24650 [Musa balbisiana]|uniref:Uncharacterized protein n=1 Tax=Musa balbisiana TaxID=52838 RepID=A0A4S8IQD4_MUSBA|nr:hypothetical protein C4D60_Mb06t24650 [Musa balbisiana]